MTTADDLLHLLPRHVTARDAPSGGLVRALLRRPWWLNSTTRRSAFFVLTTSPFASKYRECAAISCCSSQANCVWPMLPES